MLFLKRFLGVFLILVSFSMFSSPVQAFSKAECAEMAQQLYAAQGILNEDKALFDKTSQEIDALPAEKLGVTEELKAAVMKLAKQLRAGDDPMSVGNAVFQGCLLKAI